MNRNDINICHSCQWAEQCGCDDIYECDDHSPIALVEDEHEKIIENGRLEYREEWFEYLEYDEEGYGE